MWKKPWKLTDGFIAGGGLVITGLLLQYVVGPVEWDRCSWPVNGILLAILLIAVGVVWLLGRWRDVYVCRWLGGLDNAIAALCWTTLLTLLMGLIRQAPSEAPRFQSGLLDALGLTHMLDFWPMVLVYVWLTLSLGVVVLKRLSSFRWADVPFLVMHLGLFIVLTCASLGHADVQRAKMYVEPSKPEWRGLDDRGGVLTLPFTVELKEFVMELHADSLRTPKRYASDVQILTEGGQRMHSVIEVNKPASVKGWDIYQYGYEKLPWQGDGEHFVSVLELVRDPWLPVVYAGIIMMIAGAVCMLLMNAKTKRR